MSLHVRGATEGMCTTVIAGGASERFRENALQPRPVNAVCDRPAESQDQTGSWSAKMISLRLLRSAPEHGSVLVFCSIRAMVREVRSENYTPFRFADVDSDSGTEDECENDAP